MIDVHKKLLELQKWDPLRQPQQGQDCKKCICSRLHILPYILVFREEETVIYLNISNTSSCPFHMKSPRIIHLNRNINMVSRTLMSVSKTTNSEQTCTPSNMRQLKDERAFQQTGNCSTVLPASPTKTPRPDHQTSLMIVEGSSEKNKFCQLNIRKEAKEAIQTKFPEWITGSDGDFFISQEDSQTTSVYEEMMIDKRKCPLCKSQWLNNRVTQRDHMMNYHCLSAIVANKILPREKGEVLSCPSRTTCGKLRWLVHPWAVRNYVNHTHVACQSARKNFEDLCKVLDFDKIKQWDRNRGDDDLRIDKGKQPESEDDDDDDDETPNRAINPCYNSYKKETSRNITPSMDEELGQPGTNERKTVTNSSSDQAFSCNEVCNPLDNSAKMRKESEVNLTQSDSIPTWEETMTEYEEHKERSLLNSNGDTLDEILGKEGQNAIGEETQHQNILLAAASCTSQEELDHLLSPDFCQTRRCPICIKCPQCSPSEFMPLEAQRMILKTDQNLEMRKCISMCKINKEGEAEKFAIVTRLPLNEADTVKALAGTNIDLVTQEWDRKLKRMDDADRVGLSREFNKMCDLQYFVKLKELPEDLRNEILSGEVMNFISIAPAYNPGSLTTTHRTTMNASSPNQRGSCLNDQVLTGFASINLARTFRQFRYRPYYVAGDLSKFYCSTYLTRDDFKYCLLAWKKGCKIENEVEIFVITRLIFGLRCAAVLAALSLSIIAAYAISKCECEANAQLTCQSQDKSEKAKVIQCGKLPHIFKEVMESAYVDDLMWSFISQQEVWNFIKFTDELLSMFGFNVKKWEIMPDMPEKISASDFISLAGYRFYKAMDAFALKFMTVTNGVKYRGKWIKQKARLVVTDGIRRKIDSPDFTLIHIDQIKDANLQVLVDVYHGCHRSLKLLISRCAMIYDVAGVITPLHNQLRAVASAATVETGGVWEREVSEETWRHFLECMVEIAKAAFHCYPRIPKGAILKGANVILFVMTDASLSQVVACYLSYEMAYGRAIILILAKGYLSATSKTIPKLELSVVSIGANILKQLVEELKSLLREALLVTDSMVSVHWIISNKPNLMTFCKNRVASVRENLVGLPDEIFETGRNSEELDDISENEQKVLLTLHWCQGEVQPADLGTKYKRLGQPHSVPRMITADQVGPETSWYKGYPWMKDINLAKQNGILRSALVIKREDTGSINIEGFEDELKKPSVTRAKPKGEIYNEATIKSVEIVTDPILLAAKLGQEHLGPPATYGRLRTCPYTCRPLQVEPQ